ncbi:hypothetical protein EIP91_000203 [Steccherinum ochraceum]|uniref:Alanine dehydrogenase/pyridine nucleotide transhydrogenase N-terminal domain-containing protein n=1 Tax=Steccherinum ochraceum TaxID=92696 RepID=A0A4R0RY40_9APHY|nr:hypothetical protein EIP91_000203 [Steccherinum ochraceum]
MSCIRRAPFVLRRTFASSAAIDPSKITIGIRREDPQRIWERRCPLTPDAVHDLVHGEGVNVLIQDCERRVWNTNEFVKAGAIVHPTLSPSHITLGIKETPLEEVLTDPIRAPTDSATQPPLVPRTHLMFSHTVKGQLYNMELLSKFLGPSEALTPRLIDYELLTGEDGKRTVGFGWFAGVAGALESLCALAHAHLELGISSPFLYTPRPHTHTSLESIRATLRDVVGAQITAEGTPRGLGPVVFGVTGTGKVAQGVLDLLEDLPICKVRVEDLPALVANPETDLHKIYVVHALPKDYFVRADGQAYERSHYYTHPEAYTSVFHSNVAPYLTLLFNGAGWAPNFPRLMTNEQLTLASEKAQQVGKGRFACIGDISCDVEGGLEFMPQASTISSPFYTTRPATLPAHLPPVTIMSVDILPTALPLEASTHFSNVLTPYLKSLIRGYRTPGQPHLNGDVNLGRAAALERATVASNGKLREAHKWLEGPLGTWRESVSSRASGGAASAAVREGPKKKVLMLGSGMVAGPAVDEICSWKDVELVVASNILPEAQRLVSKHAAGTAISLDVSDWSKVESLINESDIVISLLPVPFHPKVAEACIQYKKNLVTASYISPAMQALHDRAVSADVLLMNEIGLDPGIDHCSAISMLSDLEAQNKRVVSFTSFCGGFPAPDNAEDVPLKYKFSWSPKGVLSAALNGARFKLWDKVDEIAGKDLLHQSFPNLPISEVLKLEGIANRDSLPYGDTYNLRPDIRTLFRGTLRYAGFSSLMHQFKAIGLLDPAASIHAPTWSHFVPTAMAAQLGRAVPHDAASVRSALADLLGPAQDTTELVQAMEWFGIAPGQQPNSIDDALLPKSPAPPIDVFAALLAHKLRYLPDERDLVVLSHEIVAADPTTGQEEIHASSLMAYGTLEASAMSRCVGLPVAFAARAVLDGDVRARGVQGPGVEKAVYGRVLSELQRVGLGMKDSVKKLGRGVLGGAVERSLAETRGLVKAA